MRYLLLFIFFISLGFVQSQQTQIIEESYFADTTIGNIDNILDFIEVEDGILISASIDSAGSELPCIIKLDLNGEVVWSTIQNSLMNYQSCGKFDIELFEDGYIYGVSHDFISYYSRINHVWKVNASTGEVVWVNLNYVTKEVLNDIVEYDSTSFLISYINNFGIPTIGYFDKTMGDTIRTKTFNYYTEFPNIEVDNSKNIFLALKDSVYKFNANDFDQIIWRKSFDDGANYIEEISEIYLDDYDDLYVFGRNGSYSLTGLATCIKADNQTGEEVWSKNIGSANVRLSDFKDENGKIYTCHRTVYVGGGSYYFESSKIDKQSGVIDWRTYNNITPLGSPTGQSGGNTAALNLDTDCSGDVYLTGYYGDANYGPAAWGILKLDGSDGSKMYDLTITNDSTTYDLYSTGLGVCVFGDSPVILGLQDDGSNTYNGSYPLYVTLEPTTGDVLVRKRIGSGYQHYSKTIDIESFSNNTYVLKQFGKDVVIEQYDASQTLTWSQMISKPAILFADQLSIDSNYIYLSAHRKDSSFQPPFYQSETASIQLFKLNRSNGTIVDNDSITFNQAGVRSIELESDNNSAFMFYTENNNIKYVKWSASSISAPNTLEVAGSNVPFKGQLNIVSDIGNTSLYVLGTNELYEIDKNTLGKSTLFTYSQGTYYDHIWLGDTLFISGQNSSGNQIVSALDFNSGSSLWEYNNGQNGEFTKIKSDSLGFLYVAGTTNDRINVSRIAKTDGTESWTNYLDTIAYPNSETYDLLVNNSDSYVAVGGAIKNPNGSSDAVIYINELQNNHSDSIIRFDENVRQSVTTSLGLLEDNSILAGGAHNRIIYPNAGFLYRIGHDGCYYLVSLVINNSNTLTASPGMDQYQWFDCNSSLAIPGETSQDFTPTYNGEFAVEVTSGSCIAMSDCSLIDDLSTDENSLDLFNIYPNPSSGKFTISSDKNFSQITITNLTGEEIIVENVVKNSHIIDLSKEAKGIYLCKIYSTQGIFTKKLVKQ